MAPSIILRSEVKHVIHYTVAPPSVKISMEFLPPGGAAPEVKAEPEKV